MIHNNLVFIIDDDLLQNEIHEILLRKSFPDLEVKSFTRSSEALRYIEKNGSPQIIFLDIHIPGEDKSVFLNKFKRRGLDSDIYLMSSMPYLDNESFYAEYPAIKDFISKPLLENKVRRLFNHSV
jgi:response regulator RpfG family c-di-GMP phosphodiesterase